MLSSAEAIIKFGPMRKRVAGMCCKKFYFSKGKQHFGQYLNYILTFLCSFISTGTAEASFTVFSALTLLVGCQEDWCQVRKILL